MTLGVCESTTRLKLFQKADSFPQRQRACFSLCLSCDSCLSACCCCYWWNCRTLLHLSPAVFRPMSSSATVLARVDVCRARVGSAGRAISFLVLVFAFALPLAFLESRLAFLSSSLRSFHFQLTRSDSLQTIGKSNTFATKLFEERHCWRMYPTANCSQEKSLCISLHLSTQFQKRVPILRHPAPRLSSNLQRGHTRVSQAS